MLVAPPLPDIGIEFGGIEPEIAPGGIIPLAGTTVGSLIFCRDGYESLSVGSSIAETATPAAHVIPVKTIVDCFMIGSWMGRKPE